jgi:hypothetical protein
MAENIDRRVKISLGLLLAALCLAPIASLGCVGDGPSVVEPTPTPTYDTFDEEAFSDPPLAYYPYVRWWWPGGAVEQGELRREIALFKDAGFSGLEVQAYRFGLTVGEIENDRDVLTVATNDFFDKMRIVGEEADRLGMAFAFTLGSGWPSGGPFVSDDPERQLLVSSLNVSGPGQYDGPLPPVEQPGYWDIVTDIMDVLGTFDEDADLVTATAARVVDDAVEPIVLDSFTDITSSVAGDTLSWQVPDGEWTVFAFYENRTTHKPAGAAYPPPADGALVADHLDPAGAEELIEGFAAPLLEACGDHPPDTVFVDSFEMVGELPWTPSFLDRFQQSKGYDLTPYLPLIFEQGGESKYTQMLVDMSGEEPVPAYASASDIGERVREDYEEVRSALFIEGFVETMRGWAHDNGMLFRMQAQGGWADYLDTYEMADIPESEGLFAGGSFDFMKMASSAAHTAGRTYTSTEAFVAIHSDPRAITLEDLYLLSGRAYAAGINRMIYHGYPYRYIRDTGERWYGYPEEHDEGMVLAGPFPFTFWLDEEHPVWPDMPSFNRYLARLCYALTRGTHEADVAWLHADWRFPDRVISNADGFPPEQGESDISIALKRAGLVYDRVSRSGLSDASAGSGSFTVGAAQYDALLVTNLNAASPELMSAIETIAAAGVPVIVIGGLPDRATGMVDHQQRDAAVQASAAGLQPQIIEVSGADALGAALESSGVEPALSPAGGGEFAFSIDRRQMEDGEVLFLFNEWGEQRTQSLEVNLPATGVRVLNPETGDLLYEALPSGSGEITLDITIPARRSLVVVVEG